MVDLINIIYEEIPNILEKRKTKKIESYSKKKELKELEEYFKYYIDCEENRKDIFELLTYNLENNNIFINKTTEQITITNLCSNKKEYIPSNKYTIKSNNEEVAKFSGNRFNILTNINDYKEGTWTNSFKNITDKVKKIDEIHNKKIIDNASEQAIKKLRKTLNKN